MYDVNKFINDEIESIQKSNPEITDEAVQAIMRVIINERAKQDRGVRLSNDQWADLKKALK